MKMQNIECRPSRLSDDIRQIAICLYQTDPYIYPSICDGDLDKWISIVTQCIRLKNNVFYYKHIMVATIDERIVGVACIIPCGKEFYFSDNISIPETLQKNVDIVEKGYFEQLVEESLHLSGWNVVSMCVHSDYRGRGIGKILFNYCISLHQNEDMYLEVIADNFAAIRLYEKAGFHLLEERAGFEPSGKSLPCLFYGREKANLKNEDSLN